MKRIATFFVLILMIAGIVACDKSETPSKAHSVPMKKYVTDQAGFVLYMPEGWKASEGTQGRFKTLFVTDPSGLYVVALFSGVSPTGNDVVALARLFAGGIQKQFPDFTIQKAMISSDKRKIVFDGTYSDLQKKRKVFRVWVTGGDGNFSYSSIVAPEGKLSASRQLLLTILSNIGIMKGAIQTSAQSVRIHAARPASAPGWFRRIFSAARLAISGFWRGGIRGK